MVELNLS